ncbi:MAG: DUF5694 domain-containing protein [Saprospiraceae bacterium]
MRILIALIFFSLGCITSNAQQDSTVRRTQVMILGTPHFHNPGADVIKSEMPDVLTPEYQQQIEAITRAIADYQPTMIALEIPPLTARDTTTQNNYQNYLQGDYKLTRWEGEQIGFRLAKQLGHQQIHNIDVRHNFPFQEMMTYAQENGQIEWLQQQLATLQAREDKDRSNDKKSLGAKLAEMNTPENLAKSHAIYVAGAQIGDINEFAGTDVLTAWYTRNARIFSHLYHITTDRSNEKILVIFGQGHAYLLRQLVMESPDFEVVEVGDYLKGK